MIVMEIVEILVVPMVLPRGWWKNISESREWSVVVVAGEALW